MSEEERSTIFWTQIRTKRTVQAIAEVLPFYIAWLVCGVLMINRKMGKTTMIFITGAFCYFEVMSRIVFGTDDSFVSILTSFQQIYPPSKTIGECLRSFRSSFVFILMCVIFFLDATIDRISKQEDPLKILNDVVAKQTSTVNLLLALH